MEKIFFGGSSWALGGALVSQEDEHTEPVFSIQGGSPLSPLHWQVLISRASGT